MANLSGSGAPSVNTVGTPGDIYTDTLTGTEYELNSIVTVTNDEETVTSYMWDRIFEFGGGGETGPQGPPGPAGADGEDGGYYTPSVSDTGDLTWTASEEGMAAIPSVNIKGPKGDPGDIFESIKTLPSSTIDFNTITENGIYSRSGVSSGEDVHSPFANKRANFILMMIQRNNTYGYGYQIAFNNTTNSEIYFRVYYDSTFEEWKKIATEEDLEGYLPLTGGAMTGNLTMSMGGKVDGFARSLYGINDGFDKTDLNNLKTPGSYTFTNSEITAAANSDSRMSSGILHVMNNSAALDDSSYKIQIYMTIASNKWYTRRYNSDGSGSWSSWKQIATLEDSDAKYFPLSGGTLTGNITMTEGTQLLGNAESATRPLYQSIIRSAESPPNLNDYVYNGFYYVDAGNSGTLLNEPIEGGAGMYYIYVHPSSPTYVHQTFYQVVTSSIRVYHRSKISSGWGSWTRILTEEDDVATKDYVDQKIAEALATVVPTLPSN